MKNSKVLIVVDESRATTKALRYVAQMAAGRPNFRACLVHTVPAPPSQLTEFRGAEKGRLRAYKSRWISAGEMTEQHALGRANAVLRRGGLARESIEALLLSCGWEPSDRGNLETRTDAQVRHHGHSLETTLNVYTHAIPESQKRAVDKVAEILFPNFLIG
jgi:hypothetical protein